MRFLLTLEDRQVLQLVYDNTKNTLCNLDGSPYPLDLISNSYKSASFDKDTPFTPDSPRIGKVQPVRLKIQLGLGCNYSCSYCSQSAYVHEAAATSTQDARDFLFNLNKWLTEAPDKIEFWGGEPLLYWAKLKILIPALREKFPAATFSMVSNGAMLTRKHVDFLKQYDCRITISHDGPGQKLRGDDPFEDPSWVDVVRYLYDTHKVVFNMVLTKFNPDPAAAIEWIRERLGRPVVCNVESVVNVHTEDGKLSDAERDTIRQKLFEGIVFGKLDDVPIINWKMQNFIEGLSYSRPSDAHGQKCGMDRRDWLAVDLEGNVLTCQNVAGELHTIGSVRDLASVKLDTSYHHSTRIECQNCPVVHLCYGACMYQSGVDFHETCKNEFAGNLGVFQALIFFLTKHVLTGIQMLDEMPAKPKRVIAIKEVPHD